MFVKHFKKIGKFDKQILANLKSIVNRFPEKKSPALWNYFPEIEHYLTFILGDQKLKISRNEKDLASIKLFVSDPDDGMGLHKDGLKNKTAMNICVDANPDDWIRWYDDDVENSYEKEIAKRFDGKILASRNLLCDDWKNLDRHIAEYSPEPGELYLVNTDVYHSFYCSGPNKRRVIQIKFEGWPDIDTVEKNLILTNIKGLEF